MSDPVKCFLITPTKRVGRWLRRYCLSETDKCTGKYGYHNAMIYLDEINGVFSTEGYLDCAEEIKPEWVFPTKCDHCEYQFKSEDKKQLFQNEFYSDEQGRRFTLSDAPPGAMWDAQWIHSERRKRNSDGLFLYVKCPNGREWGIDGKSSNGDGWIRQGIPPILTVTPSIWADDYHGFLQNGIFTPDLSGNTYMP